MIKLPNFDYKLDLILGLGLSKDDALKVRQVLTAYEQELDRLNQMEEKPEPIALEKPVFPERVKWVTREVDDEGVLAWFGWANEPKQSDIGFIDDTLPIGFWNIDEESENYLNHKYGHLPWTECKFRVEDV